LFRQFAPAVTQNVKTGLTVGSALRQLGNRVFRQLRACRELFAPSRHSAGGGGRAGFLSSAFADSWASSVPPVRVCRTSSWAANAQPDIAGHELFRRCVQHPVLQLIALLIAHFF
jgi:hypothetical protein